MRRGKIRYDNLDYQAFVQIMASCCDDDGTLQGLMQKIEQFMTAGQDRYRFIVRPYSKALRVTLLLQAELDRRQTEIAARLRLQFKDDQRSQPHLNGNVKLDVSDPEQQQSDLFAVH